MTSAPVRRSLRKWLPDGSGSTHCDGPDRGRIDELGGRGYSRVRDDKLGGQATANARLYEDPYSVVSLIVYEAWSELASSWTDAQAELVELMSAYMTSADPKSWEGYLVLLTPGSASGDEVQSLSSIRYDISRVRKLVATGDELKQISDVERTLLPLLPLEAAPSGNGEGDRSSTSSQACLPTRGSTQGPWSRSSTRSRPSNRSSSPCTSTGRAHETYSAFLEWISRVPKSGVVRP